jgi:hypothetical protein
MNVNDQFSRTGTSYGDSGIVYTHTITITKIGPKRACFTSISTWDENGETMTHDGGGSWFNVSDITADDLPPTGSMITFVDGPWVKVGATIAPVVDESSSEFYDEWRAEIAAVEPVVEIVDEVEPVVVEPVVADEISVVEGKTYKFVSNDERVLLIVKITAKRFKFQTIGLDGAASSVYTCGAAQLIEWIGANPVEHVVEPVVVDPAPVVERTRAAKFHYFYSVRKDQFSLYDGKNKKISTDLRSHDEIEQFVRTLMNGAPYVLRVEKGKAA